METKKELLSQMLKRFIEGDAISLREQQGVMQLPLQPGALFEINEETYEHFIETVPPMFMGGHLFCYIQGIPNSLFRRKDGFFVRQLTPADPESFWACPQVARDSGLNEGRKQFGSAASRTGQGRNRR